jgi:hypothetical protein
MLILQEEVEDTKGAIITRTYKAMAKRKNMVVPLCKIYSAGYKAVHIVALKEPTLF